MEPTTKDTAMQSHDRAVAAILELPEVIVGRLWTVLREYPQYMVAEDGTVVSVLKKARVLKPIKRGTYRGFTLRNREGELRPVYLHRLVAEAWHGPSPDGAECRHLNGNKANNTARNLAWGTHLENMRDSVALGQTAAGERNARAKLSTETVAAMRRLRAASGLSFAKIAEQFNVSTMTAYRAIVGQSWRNQNA